MSNLIAVLNLKNKFDLDKPRPVKAYIYNDKVEVEYEIHKRVYEKHVGLCYNLQPKILRKKYDLQDLFVMNEILNKIWSFKNGSQNSQLHQQP
jgi:hypothetical protein